MSAEYSSRPRPLIIPVRLDMEDVPGIDGSYFHVLIAQPSFPIVVVRISLSCAGNAVGLPSADVII